MPEYRKKLIEVALPLEAINKESAREKLNRHEHPSTLHLWWARRPLAACRAVLFAQIVDDPSSLPNEFSTKELQEVERQRLFRIIEELVKWENTTNEAVLHAARVAIARSVALNDGISLTHNMSPAEVTDALRRYSPPVLDPFAGGGSIPLEAQRLGLEAHASDLNPVAVIINKALIEIPPKFAGCPPVNPESCKTLLRREWKGAQGLAEDVRYYGKWMRDRAWERIGYLYPKVQLPQEYGGGEAIVIGWMWARIVTCPNPACGGQMPLVSSFWLSKKDGKRVWLQPEVDRKTTPATIHFTVRSGTGSPQDPPKAGRGALFRCLACSTIATESYIRGEASSGRMDTKLMCIVADTKGGRVYLPPTPEHVVASQNAYPDWRPAATMPENPRWFSPPLYGLPAYGDLFTQRQLVALVTFSNLIGEARTQVLTDADGDELYANAIATYLALAVDRFADYWSTLVRWQAVNQQLANTFSRQAIPMIWDFVEANPFSYKGGSFDNLFNWTIQSLSHLSTNVSGVSRQLNATAVIDNITHPLISTDPPYYDNIGYADLSDYFYVWLRRSLGIVYPELFRTLLTPKTEELIATPYRFNGNAEHAKHFFEEGLGKAFARMRESGHPSYPLTVYYAFKQAESEGNGDESGSIVSASTGWETMLEGLLRAGFTITGTWPIRTEMTNRSIGLGTNALASSIVLVCRPRATDAPLTTRRDFLQALKRELPKALRDLQHGNIAPVDLAQAAIGPGMAVFSRYSNVLESDGTPMRVRTALQLINQTLDEVLAEQEGEYDADTRWAVAWFEQYGMEEGPYGVAETLSKAKNTAVGALVEAGILRAKGGKVRLLRREEFSSNWNPATAKRLTVWEVTQRLIRALQEQGEAGAAAILDHVGAYGEVARDLAYRLYTVCERKKWADEALAYNSLVVEWSDISGAAEQLGRTTAEQARLFS
jgi:putative DNA methylase